MSIKIKNVNYTYSEGTAYEIHALKDINLEIPDGQAPRPAQADDVCSGGRRVNHRESLLTHENRLHSSVLPIGTLRIPDAGEKGKSIREDVRKLLYFQEDENP